MSDKLDIRVMRSQLGQVRGMGAAKSGVHHWYVKRATSIALVPLTLWFVAGMIRMAGRPQEVVKDWVGHPVNTVLLLALIGTTFHHMQLGIQDVLEDYVDSNAAKAALILVNKAVAGLLALTAAVAVLKLSLA